MAGLVATYGLNLNVLQAWVIWNLCNVENKMISVERILQFSNIPSEAPLIIEDCRPEPEWPKEGIIEFIKLHIQYDPTGPMVLKGVTCVFPGQKKIGVVGRTGSGKSTLVQALFRVVEPLDGCILIDGVNISKIGLQDLRSKLGIIPQDPTLFLGTVRTNLDPLEQHTDQELWEVLSKCHLAEIVQQDPRLLDAPVAENGENWSVGQRQLVCLARLLLKKRKILVLDEATASIDTATDNLIQKTIREETSGCTVITVAHRIPTVIDNDLVLVLNEGTIAEYDKPSQLLQDSSSSFSKLVSEFLRRSSQSNC
jgi:ABC-type multidrug transport system fused ATPase/permease subunit